jgi:RNA polymerase sigma-70 factor (ECF subfamily)
MVFSGQLHHSMIETELSPIHSLPTGLCEDSSGEAADLIARMAKADPAALVELYGMWNPIFRGISCQMLGNRRDAENVVQDTFVSLWQRAAAYDPHQAPPFVWAFTIMRSCCMDRLRSRRRSTRHASRANPHPPTTRVEKHDNPRVLALDDSRRVRAALDQLNPEERSALISAVLLEFASADRSKSPDPSISTVKNHLRQALKTICNHLSRYEL